MYKMKIPLYFCDDFKSAKKENFLFLLGRSRSNTRNVHGLQLCKKKEENIIMVLETDGCRYYFVRLPLAMTYL